jgi:hypothetical protein
MIGVLPPAVRRRSFRSGYFPASLRLRSTSPFAEPQAEALHISIWSQPNNETNSSEADIFRLLVHLCSKTRTRYIAGFSNR